MRLSFVTLTATTEVKMAYNNNKNMPGDLMNYYLTVNVNNLCRICLEKGSKLMPIFDPIKPPHFSILIMACATVQVLEGDGLPPYICQKCISKLNIAFQFKTQCESSDAKLRASFQSFHIQPAPDLNSYIEIKKDMDISLYSQTPDGLQQIHIHQIATPVDTLHTVTNITDALTLHHHHQQHEEPLLQNLDTSTIHMPTESTLQELDKNTLTELKLEFSDLKPFEIDDGTNKTNEVTLNLENVSEAVLQTQEEVKPEKQKLVKFHECGTCGKTFRSKPSLIHHIRIHTGERPYVCHICEKRFINGGHLHTHMRTHTGEKNHVCVTCSKAFSTAQQLTKHTIAIHTSERPYGCTYCPKRFASSSNLNTHTKIHTGEKNYRCDQCGKAFSTKGQLYQHMLVHTGEKAFLCEYCNKRFTQKAHLMRHLKIHRT